MDTFGERQHFPSASNHLISLVLPQWDQNERGPWRYIRRVVGWLGGVGKKKVAIKRRGGSFVRAQVIYTWFPLRALPALYPRLACRTWHTGDRARVHPHSTPLTSGYHSNFTPRLLHTCTYVCTLQRTGLLVLRSIITIKLRDLRLNSNVTLCITTTLEFLRVHRAIIKQLGNKTLSEIRLCASTRSFLP
jgi:hypothetical protein